MFYIVVCLNWHLFHYLYAQYIYGACGGAVLIIYRATECMYHMFVHIYLWYCNYSFEINLIFRSKSAYSIVSENDILFKWHCILNSCVLFFLRLYVVRWNKLDLRMKNIDHIILRKSSSSSYLVKFRLWISTQLKIPEAIISFFFLFTQFKCVLFAQGCLKNNCLKFIVKNNMKYFVFIFIEFCIDIVLWISKMFQFISSGHLSVDCSPFGERNKKNSPHIRLQCGKAE